MIQALTNLNNLHFNGLLLTKVYNVWAKTSNKELFDDTENWCKTWRKTDFCFQQWHEEFDKCSPQHLKVAKLGLWWGPFNKIRKCMCLNFTGELRDMIMKNDTIFEEEWGILKILTRALKYLKNLLFSGLLLTKVCNVWTKKAWRSYLSWPWRVVFFVFFVFFF